MAMFLIFSFLFGVVYCQDNSCCDDGWVSYGSSCYLFADTSAVHFTEAEHYCRQHGGHLVTIESSTENAFLKTFTNRFGGADYWMGLTDEIAEGVWKWTHTGSLPTFTDWKPGEPNNDRNQDCAHFQRGYGGRWDDTWCASNNLPLCEKRKVASPSEVVG